MSWARSGSSNSGSLSRRRSSDLAVQVIDHRAQRRARALQRLNHVPSLSEEYQYAVFQETLSRRPQRRQINDFAVLIWRICERLLCANGHSVRRREPLWRYRLCSFLMIQNVRSAAS